MSLRTKTIAVRNDVHRGDSEEFMVLRHYKLAKGMHRAFYDLSRPAMWQVYQKIGARVMGDWQVIYPEGEGGSKEYDESFRLARYASLEHWKDTRKPAGMMGTGPFTNLALESDSNRNRLVLGTRGSFYLRGHMAPDVPYHLPSLDEAYDVVNATESLSSPRPVRYERPLTGQELVVLEQFEIEKGSFATFSSSEKHLWPFLSKLGVRVMGEWQVISLDPVGDSMSICPAGCDEVLFMARYASYQHWQAAQRLSELGGDGPDCVAAEEALRARSALVRGSSRTFLSGYLYDNPAQYAPVIPERYKRIQARL